MLSGDSNGLEVKTVREAMDRPTIAMIKKVVDPLIIETHIAAKLKQIVEWINVDSRLNLNQAQIPIVAEMLVNQYPVETIEDIILCLTRGSAGFYGELYRLDAAVINGWMKQYLDEKYQIIESQQKKHDHNFFAELAEQSKEVLTEIRNKLNKQFVPGEFKIVLENKRIPRPAWIVGEKCPNCEGFGRTSDIDNPQLVSECHVCGGLGKINAYKVHADSQVEADKAYKAMLKSNDIQRRNTI